MKNPIANTPESTTDVFVHYFNEGNIENLIEAYYEPDGVLAAEPGKGVSGKNLAEALVPYFALKGKMRATTRHTLRNNDIALLIIDWFVDYVDENGNPAQYPGVSTDVVRKGSDGIWRCIIDNPHNIK